MAQIVATRPSEPRKVQPKLHVRSGTRSTFSSVVTLARWQFHQTWRFLLVIGVGMLLAVTLVCAIPLYVQVSLSAGLRHTLAENPQNEYLTISAQSSLFSSDELQSVQLQLTQIVRSELGATTTGSPALSVQVPAITVTSTSFSTAMMQLVGTDTRQAARHVRLLRGRLPAPTSGNTIEFAAVAQGQKDLNLQLNKTFALPFGLEQSGQPITNHIDLRLVGIIAPTDGSDIFWHGETFEPGVYLTQENLPVLVSNSELINVLDDLSSTAQQFYPPARFVVPVSIYWYYAFDFSHLDINHLSDLTSSLTQVLTTISNNPQVPPYIVGTTSLGPLSILQSYTDRVTVIKLPISCLAYLIAGLVLFFALLMTDVLVERQMEAITLLRSRGASARQIFGSLFGQGVGLGLLVLLAGPLLAILLVIGLANFTMTAGSLQALNLLTDGPLAVAQGQLQRALLIVGIALLGMIWYIWRALRSNILMQRRENARASQQPFWMRFKLDVIAAVIALSGFGFSLYIASPGVLDVYTRTLVLPLTSLVGVLFLLLSFLLLFLRILPRLLRLGEHLAARRRGAAPVLALAQLARAPRQSLRMTLLFALAIAFALFTLAFDQTEAQRLADITVYQVGSDFSGTIPSVLGSDTPGQQIAYYRGIKGITSVTIGSVLQMEGGSNQNVTIALDAVDSSTYGSTIYWPVQDSSQSIGQLMRILQAGRAEAEMRNVIPAIIDDAAAQSLGLSVGQQFVLADFHGPMNFMVVGIVQYLPTIYDTAGGTGSDTSIPQGGVLVDFQTYSDVALAVNENGVSATNVWLRASSRPADLASARRALFTGTYALENGEDRRALARSLAGDPLYTALLGILAIGAGITLLLGTLSTLLVLWWNARSRQTSFAVLRALGCEPAQIARVLLWEQGIVYGTGLILGLLLSVVFALLILPAFIFSPLENASSAETFYLAQSVPAVRMVIPLWPTLGLLAGLTIVCSLALALTLRVVIRTRIGQTLRIDEG